MRVRIDQIVSQAEQQGSLAVAISGLNSIRHTLDSLTRLAGYDRPIGSQINVAVQTDVNFDLTNLAERLMTVDGWIVADEAARLSTDMIAALRPMRARRPEARFAMLFTAWSRTDPFWTAWENDEPSWIRLKATADTDNVAFEQARLPATRRARDRIPRERGRLQLPAGAA